MRTILFFVFFFFAIASTFAQSKDAPIFSTKAGAIKGYDPVAYFYQSKPVKGQDGITHTWNGATWHFSTTQNRELFAKNPEKYVPQYGGYCAYGWSQGYAVKTEPEAWSVVDGKLYLNYDMDIRNKWEKKRAEYIKLADVNWGKRK
jgi:YHS domain-containing protein